MISKLFTTYYAEGRGARRGELDISLAVNAISFDQVCVLAEDCRCDVPANGICRQIDRRQTYIDLISWANERAEPEDLIVLANCDIVIPPDAVRQLQQHLRRDQAFCLSRWEIARGGNLWHYAHAYSQDVWAFRGPIVPVAADWPFGIPGCENKFAWLLDECGYRVSNPSKTIRTWHVHASALRSRTNRPCHRLQPPYLWVPPVQVGETLPLGRQAEQAPTTNGVG